MSSRLAAALADSGPVTVLAGIAAAGSFTHIRDTARQHGQHGWMSWAVAVCIDLTCVMAARERQRDKRTGRKTGPVSWPTVVLAGGIILSLAANLAQAQQTTWGWLAAATPAVAFLLAISMLERRAGSHQPAPQPAATAVSQSSPSPSPVPSGHRPAVPDGLRPQITGPDEDSRPADHIEPAAPLVEFARKVADEHQAAHGRPITRDALRARLGVSNQLASDLLRQLRTGTDTGD